MGVHLHDRWFMPLQCGLNQLFCVYSLVLLCILYVMQVNLYFHF
jgi:hypothetical protein